ncbi:cell division protein ZapE [Pseudofrancisella aestuarii]|uniref:Cell division protein ZapE n=1 Tax=Pseudofrancisella aestuarii TaxID=2670347 RepID=A0ABV9TCV6_9GAMM|nr:cell division protein ZapE [Pseudofrancisella aestuarii]
MLLLEVYEKKIEQSHLRSDPLQLEAIRSLDRITNQLKTKKRNKFNFFSKSLYPSIIGLYMWGGVGRGKTFIMDIFFDNVPIINKSRLHFSHFMKNMHFLLKKYSGQKNPISKAAYEIAKKNQLICFDEFFVEDIADAMILGKVFKELFDLGVVLVATSNIHPSKLYSNGLQRELFLPAIDVLIENVDVLNLDSGVDYRFCKDVSYLNYFYPYNDQMKDVFFDKFFAENISFEKNVDIEIINRKIPALIVGENSICFDVSVICGSGRSALDYIELCSKYRSIFLYNLKAMHPEDGNNCNTSDESIARRFIALIDECYDQGIKVIILAAEDFKSIYQGRRLQFEFQRTVSRLNDMQSENFGEA